MATNSPTMMAGAEEPATLSGFCQPMAIAMVREEARQSRFGVCGRRACRGSGLAMRGWMERFDHLRATSLAPGVGNMV